MCRSPARCFCVSNTQFPMLSYELPKPELYQILSISTIRRRPSRTFLRQKPTTELDPRGGLAPFGDRHLRDADWAGLTIIAGHAIGLPLPFVRRPRGRQLGRRLQREDDFRSDCKRGKQRLRRSIRRHCAAVKSSAWRRFAMIQSHPRQKPPRTPSSQPRNRRDQRFESPTITSSRSRMLSSRSCSA